IPRGEVFPDEVDVGCGRFLSFDLQWIVFAAPRDEIVGEDVIGETYFTLFVRVKIIEAQRELCAFVRILAEREECDSRSSVRLCLIDATRTVFSDHLNQPAAR